MHSSIQDMAEKHAAYWRRLESQPIPAVSTTRSVDPFLRIRSYEMCTRDRMLVSLPQCPSLRRSVRRARRQLHYMQAGCHQSTMAHVYCTATGYAASQDCKAYVGVLCDEQHLRALLVICLHPLATASTLANTRLRDTVAPVRPSCW